MPYDENGEWYPDPEQEQQQPEEEYDAYADLPNLLAQFRNARMGEPDQRTAQRDPRQEEDAGVQVEPPADQQRGDQQQEAPPDTEPGMVARPREAPPEASPYGEWAAPRALTPREEWDQGTQGGIHPQFRGIRPNMVPTGRFDPHGDPILEEREPSPNILMPRARTGAPGQFQPPGGPPQRNNLPPGEEEIRAAEDRMNRLMLRPEERANFNRLNQAGETIRRQLASGEIDENHAAEMLGRVNELRGQYESRVAQIPRTERELHNALLHAQAAQATNIATQNAGHWAPNPNSPQARAIQRQETQQRVEEARTIQERQRRAEAVARISQDVRREVEHASAPGAMATLPPGHWLRQEGANTPAGHIREARARIAMNEALMNPDAAATSLEGIRNTAAQMYNEQPWQARLPGPLQLGGPRANSHAALTGELHDMLQQAVRANRDLTPDERAVYEQKRQELRDKHGPEVADRLQLPGEQPRLVGTPESLREIASRIPDRGPNSLVPLTPDRTVGPLHAQLMLRQILQNAANRGRGLAPHEVVQYNRYRAILEANRESGYGRIHDQAQLPD